MHPDRSCKTRGDGGQEALVTSEHTYMSWISQTWTGGRTVRYKPLNLEKNYALSSKQFLSNPTKLRIEYLRHCELGCEHRLPALSPLHETGFLGDTTTAPNVVSFSDNRLADPWLLFRHWLKSSGTSMFSMDWFTTSSGTCVDVAGGNSLEDGCSKDINSSGSGGRLILCFACMCSLCEALSSLMCLHNAHRRRGVVSVDELRKWYRQQQCNLFILNLHTIAIATSTYHGSSYSYEHTIAISWIL